MSKIIHIETAVPDYCYSQSEIARDMLQLFSDRITRKYINSIYHDSGIEKRYSILDQLTPGNEEKFFQLNSNSEITEPSTKSRNDIFRSEAKKLINKLCTATFKNCSLPAKEITHVITVSCTGFYNPGPDLDVINVLGLSESTERYNLGFMGCYGAFPALKMANQFCLANPQANVLIICLELCTLHFQLKNDLDTTLANSIFADGAAAVIVSNQNLDSPNIQINTFNSSYLPEGNDDMSWSIGNHGFDMVLSRYVPQIISSNIHSCIQKLLDSYKLKIDDITTWAVHPGGKTILDKVEQTLSIENVQIESSRKVLI